MSEPERLGCEEALSRLAAYLDAELGEAERISVAAHLDTCRSCYSRAEFERRLKERIRSELRISAISPRMESRIQSLLRGPADAAGTPASAVAPPPTKED